MLLKKPITFEKICAGILGSAILNSARISSNSRTFSAGAVKHPIPFLRCSYTLPSFDGRSTIGLFVCAASALVRQSSLIPENSKAFKEALKKAKTDADKNPECIVKLFKKAQTKGEALSGIKELCLTKAEAAQTNKPIVLLPSKDGRVYEQRRNEIGCFTAPAENVREFEDIRAEFKMALPKIPAHIFSKVMGFFKSISDELHYEVLVHILYDTEEKEYIIKVPKQRISEASVNSETDEPYPDRYIHVMDFHSHNTMPAIFSGTDNADEKETRLYAVAGRFNRTFPEITVRAGCAGKFIPLNPEDVFEGDFFGSYPEEWKENIRHWGTEIKKPWHMSLRLKRTFGEDRI